MILLREYENLIPWQTEMIGRFKERTGEPFPQAEYELLPRNSFAWFLEATGFIWSQIQLSEIGNRILRVHALYLEPTLSKRASLAATEAFEDALTVLAQETRIQEIGFYTRRAPQSFIRRLNRTSPQKWELDSYVICRKV